MRPTASVAQVVADAVEVPVDVVVVGTGVAGLTAALDAAEQGARVLVVTRGRISDGSTGWAQGGLAAVLAEHPVPGDDLDLHVQDTVVAGAGLCDQEAVRSILAGAGPAVARLAHRGAVFDVDDDGRWLRAREGGHSAARVVRAGGDATGAEVSRALVARADRSGLVVLEGHRATDLLTDDAGRVAGVRLAGPGGRVLTLGARTVVLATGGSGQLFARTTNPPAATGDGLALALRAGARVADVEFVQFHPTALWVPDSAGGQVPLVTEAVRGEGGTLRDDSGARVMEGVHPARDLAPRDVVAAAIFRHLARTGSEHVWLDATGIPDFTVRFPTVAASCARIGVDPSRDPIPVVPAAHYHCGGVFTDLEGWTGVDGLYAVGEVARTGLHGANRLASNSLVEGLVMGQRAAQAALRALPGLPAPQIGDLEARHPAWTPLPGPGTSAQVRPDPEPAMTAVRAAMTRHLGMARTAEGLDLAAAELSAAARTTRDLGPAGGELAMLTLAARSVVEAAAAREESRGCHRRVDHPQRREELRSSTCWRLADRTGGDSLRACTPSLAGVRATG
ncbi:MAG TPA: L-aspartate oxidase [Kineosporiaceae bacterium]|nr:L-aspartate oxidase [Kineosporiaceae bacterium]